MPSDAHVAVAARIAAQVPGYSVGTNIFYGEVRAALPDGTVPVTCLFVGYPENGEKDHYLGAGSDNVVDVDVMVRGAPEDEEASRAIAKACMAALDRAVLPDFYSCITQDSEPEFMGRDDADCPVWAFTVEARYTAA